MFALLKKEISGFFSTITGYLAIVVYLLMNSLFVFVFQGDYNILDGGYADLRPLFMLSPWVFMFLVPAITMRLFAEEKRTGTIELLLTRPLTELQIVLAKYFAGLLIVLFSLLFTLIYFYSIIRLGDPVGNIDLGGTWGSYIGLFFLAAIYVAIGLFSSSITENQIVAFIIGMMICFFFYFGFEAMSTLGIFAKVQSSIVSFGINEHYSSVSRGVVDTRDLIYFVSIIAVFIFFTKTVLESRKW